MGKKPRLIRWRALYKDGKFLDQYKNPYDEDIEDQNKYTDIDRSKLTGLMLYQGIKRIRVLAHIHLGKGCRLFLRNRVWKRIMKDVGKCVKCGKLYKINLKEMKEAQKKGKILMIKCDCGHEQPASPEAETQVRIYIAGWEKILKSGEIQRLIVVVSEDGEIINIFDDWKPEIGLDAINLMKCEKVECGE